MNIWRGIYVAKEIAGAMFLDVVTMGGFLVVDGKSKTGQKIEELMQDEEDRARIREARKLEELEK